VIGQGLERGHEFSALARRRPTPGVARGLTIVAGDARSTGDLAAVLPGHDMVISVLGHRGGDNTILADSAQALLDAMKMADIARCLFVSQGLLFPSRNPLLALLRLILARHVADSRAMEAAVRASDRDWTIVRPPRLTNKGKPGGYRAVKDWRPPGGSVMDRADLAAFLLDEAETGNYPRSIVGVAAGRDAATARARSDESR
jgi:putative NADH-flavin reductase